MQESKIIKVREEELNLLYYLGIISKRMRMIACVTFACALITAVVTFIMPPTYKAETRILPPQSSNSGIASQMLSQLGASSSLTSGASGLLGLKSANDVYVGMLKSRTMYDYIIDRFGLMELYKTRYLEDARAGLAGSVTIKNGSDDIISVSVEDKDPRRAADIANAFIENLKNTTKSFAITEAAKRRLFFEEQLSKVREDLITAEDSMQRLQEKTGALDMDEQAKTIIASIAGLRAQIAAREVEIEVMRTYTEPMNPDLKKSEEALKSMKQQLQKLESKSGETPDPLMPTGRIPKTGAEYTRKLRELKYQETLFDLMEKEYEIARVDEARDATIIQVIDKAVPPGKKSKPKRTLMVAAATFSGFFLAVLLALLIELLKNVYIKEETGS
jgi:tyrosine-protein kinase Etk/Wzc